MRKLALIILDGWGLGEAKPNNAIHTASTPFFDHLWNNYPHTQLQASGEFVGLPVGQIGGSEVGHLTIGAGRVIYQQLPRINKSLKKDILDIKNFIELIQLGKKHTIHLLGFISTGGVHSHEEHLFRLLELLKENDCRPPIIHFLSDGRDTPPKSGIDSAKRLIKKINELKFGSVATLIGRFFAGDRDKNWDRTEKAINALLRRDSTNFFNNVLKSFQESYDQKITDEFIEPVIVDLKYQGIQPSDVLFFFNFRSDRMKQLITKIHELKPENKIFTMTQYDKTYDFPVIFEKETVKDTLGEILSDLGHTQMRAAETEKAPHVTYFFNGGVEVVFKGETRHIAESHKVKHDTIPHMKAEEIHQNVREQVEVDHPDFILINFANPDMVGHTGNFQAVIAGVEKVDHELKLLCEYLTKKEYICCITADHGNADIMYDIETGEPHTAHTLNPVPFIVYDPNDQKNQSLKLDQNHDNGLHKIAGTVLELMELKEHGKKFESLIT